MRLALSRSLVSLASVALLLSSLGMGLGPTPTALASSTNPNAGHVYVLNNDLTGSNSITVFNRASDGMLTMVETVSIGGLGSLTAFADGTQGSLILNQDSSRLFAVDAGSNQVSVIDVHNGQLSLAGVFSSGGTGPVSLSYQDGLLYVLNAANGTADSANVTGFHVDSNGRLHPIPGSTQPLSTAQPDPGQVQIDPSRRYLLVTEKLTNLIDVYTIQHDGSLSAATTFPSVGEVPFGMAFRRVGAGEQFIVSDALGGPNNTGGATAYDLAGGNIELINGPVYDHQIAPCWMVITRDGRYAYTSDADSETISGYRIHADGSISLLNADGVTGKTPVNTFPLEEALSRNSQYLYVLDSELLLPVPGPATISGFLIHRNGSLSSVVDESQISLPFTAIGLAAD